MKHKITLTNTNFRKCFNAESDFKSVIVSNVKYSNSKDCPNLLLNWMYGPNEAIFSIPISKAYSNQIDKFDAVKLAKDFDEPFNGPFRKIDVRFKGRFKSNESSMSFEIELK
jgi:hypothetical protein